MNEYLPYEEQLQEQLAHLPLPDEDLAWDDMKRRLEEDEERRPFFFWLRGCAGWGLLGILLLGLGWWLLKTADWFRKKQDTETVMTEKENGKTGPKDTTAAGTKKQESPVAKNNAADTVITQINRSTDSSRIDVTGAPTSKKEKEVAEKKRPGNDIPAINPGNRKKASKPVPSKERVTNKPKPVKEKTHVVDTVQPGKDVVSQEPGPIAKDRTAEVKPDTATNISKTNPLADSTVKKKSDTTSKATDPLVRESKPKKDSSKKNNWDFNAGIAIHQQIPLGGQQLTPYNSLGRKGSLADYIPSVYIRAGRENKWFLQAEFRYGAPQYTKQFMYRQTVVPDTGSNPVFSTVTSSSLKKTFYHQLPLSFNYFIRPGWSLGAGFQWNLFKSAVSERSVYRKNNFTQLDSLVSKEIRTEDTTGSVFRKSYWQAVLETQFKWKRFSIGARYAFGLEPYIRFALPGQPVRQERNYALQVFLRYKLWQNKK